MTDALSIEVLALAYALLDDSNWFSSRNSSRNSSREPAYCALTAFSMAWENVVRAHRLEEAEVASVRLRQLVLLGCGPGWMNLPHYNDAPGRRKRDVLRLYEKAAAKVGK